MTTSTPRVNRPGPPRGSTPAHPGSGSAGGGRAAGFSLAEVMMAASLSTGVLAGILATFLLIGRTGLDAAHYAQMNAELRGALDQFNRDVRLAADVRWADEHRLTLIPPTGPAITYAYVAAADPAEAGGFIRQVGDATPRVLVSRVAPDFAFHRYRLPDSSADAPPLAANDFETKQLEVRLRAVRNGASRATVSQNAVSARCVLRNKTTGQ